MFIHYYVVLFKKGIGGAYGQTLCQAIRTIYCYLVWHHIFDILSHLFSSRGPSYDATGNGGYYRVSRND